MPRYLLLIFAFLVFQQKLLFAGGEECDFESLSDLRTSEILRRYATNSPLQIIQFSQRDHDFNNQFARGEEIKSGGQATVYEGMQAGRFPRRIAIKSWNSRTGGAKEEFEILEAIHAKKAPGSHFIVQPIALGGSQFAMEWAPRSLLSFLGKKEPPAHNELTFASVHRYLTQLASSLQAAHDAGYVHRDIKPGNILVTDDDEIRLIDFGGAAKENDIASEGGGTPSYRHPESQFGPAKKSYDLYSLCTTVADLVIGMGVDSLSQVGGPPQVFTRFRDNPFGSRHFSHDFRRSPFTIRTRLNRQFGLSVPLDPRFEMISSIAHERPFQSIREFRRALLQAWKYQNNVNGFYLNYFGKQVLERVPDTALAARILRAPEDEAKRFIENTLGISAEKTNRVFEEINRLLALPEPSPGEPVSILDSNPYFDRALARRIRLLRVPK